MSFIDDTRHPIATAAALLASPALVALLLALPARAFAVPPEADFQAGEPAVPGDPWPGASPNTTTAPSTQPVVTELDDAYPDTPGEAEDDQGEDYGAEEREDHAPLDDRPLAAWDHIEVSMGFVGGLRRFDRMAFRGDPTLDPSLWRAPPFDGVQAYGLRYDARLVVAYTRMTVGIDIPFTQYAVDETTRSTPDGGQSTVAGIKPFAFRFGIGGELPVGPVAPFVDILGSIHSVKAVFDIDDVEREVRARAFGFSVRAGVRLHVRKWFFAAIAGEAGIAGPMVWAADLSVGFAVM